MMNNDNEPDNRFDRDTLLAADAAYNVDTAHPEIPVDPPPGEWEWRRNFANDEESFQAAVFERVINGRVQRMYAIAGIDPEEGPGREADIGSAARLGLSQVETAQFRAMIAEATTLAREQGVEITFAGHSMGGGLASIAAYHVQYALETNDEPSEREPGRVRMRSWNGFGTTEFLRGNAREDEEGQHVPFDPAIAGQIDAVMIHAAADWVAPKGTHWGRVRTFLEPGVLTRTSLTPGGNIRMSSKEAHRIDTLNALVGADGSGLDTARDSDPRHIRGFFSGRLFQGAIQRDEHFDPFQLGDPDRTAPHASLQDSEPDRNTGETTLLSTSDATQPPDGAVPLSARADLSAPPGQGEIRAGAGDTVFSVADRMTRKLGRSVTAEEIRALNALQTSGNNRFREGEAVRVPGPDGAGPGRGPGDAELADGVRVRDLGEAQAHLLENKLGRSLREIARDPALRKQARALFEDGFVEPAGADGLPRGLGRRLAMIAAGDGPKAAAKTLQQAANRLGAGLRADGVAGPRTRSAVKDLLRTAGEGALEEAVALSRFHGLAGDLVDGPGDPDGPGRAFDVSLGTLFPKRPAGKPGREVRVLQEATNEASRFAGRKPGLRIDGIFGPRTAAAMTDAIRARGPDDFTDDLAGRFGIPGAGARGKPARGRLPRSF